MIQIVLTLLLLAFSASCQFFQKKPSFKKDKELRLALPEDPTTLDPRKGGDAASATLHLILFEGLMQLHQDGSLTPAQCTSVHISPDQKIYTFHLGKTVWSDGHPVTSYDFEKAWKMILSPSFPAPNAHLLYPILYAEEVKRGALPVEDVGISAPDPFTLIVKLHSPTPYFLNLISFCVFAPIPSHKEDNSPDSAFHSGKQFVCNGPFILSDWKHNNELHFKKNPLYRDIEQVKLESIHISIIGSETTTFELYEKGKLDLIGPPFSRIPLESGIKTINNTEFLITPSAATTFITFNTTTFPFSNKNLRKAFSLAIQREVMVQNVTGVEESAAFCAVPPSLKNNQGAILYKEGQIEEAGRLFTLALEELQASKKELEHSLIYLYAQGEINHKIAQVLQEQWLTLLDVHVQLAVADRATQIDLLSKKKHIFGQALYRAQYSDPINILERFKHKENIKNYSSWENKTFQSLLERSFQEFDSERMATLQKAECVLLEETPITPLFHLNLCYLVKPYLKNIELSPSGGIFFERLSLQEEPLPCTSN